MTEQTVSGIAITVALMSFVVMLINMKDTTDPNVVLTIQVREVNGRLTCHADGPDGGYKLSHSMFAAACLSAEAIRLMDQGVEGGLQMLQEQTLYVLKGE